MSRTKSIPTERELIEWEQEDAIFDMLTRVGRPMTMREMVAYGPVGKSVKNPMDAAASMSAGILRPRLDRMVRHKILQTTLVSVSDDRVCMAEAFGIREAKR